jgi:hypothetical protein
MDDIRFWTLNSRPILALAVFDCNTLRLSIGRKTKLCRRQKLDNFAKEEEIFLRLSKTPAWTPKSDAVELPCKWLYGQISFQPCFTQLKLGRNFWALVLFPSV